MKEYLGVYVIGVIATIAISMLIALGLNAAFNKYSNRTFDNGVVVSSHPTGPSGHTEYFLFPDSSQIVKKYNPFGHRAYSSKLYIDSDGDDIPNTIMIYSSELKWHRLKKILLYENDSLSHQKEFSKGTKLIKENKPKENKLNQKTNGQSLEYILK
ncbi:hypothetical protein HOD29_05010 [archaeon]|jgi:hypothetical protein|nr:hypothetical protein [archaeon]